MFNFKAFSQGLMDNELSDKAFRLLALLLNNLSLQKVDELEVYNDYIMKELKWSRRTVIYTMNELVEKGYIIKETAGNKGNKKPNRIKVSAKSCTEFYESECKNEQKVSAKSCTLYKSTLNTSRSMETENKLTKAEVTKRNDFITSTYRKLEQRLNYLYTVKTSYVFNAVTQDIEEIFRDAQEKEDWFTEAQWEKLCRYADRWTKIDQAKQDYLSNVKKENLLEEDEVYLQYKQEIENLTAGAELVNV